MTLKEKIQSDRLTALKAGEKRQNLVLSTLLGELDRVAKEPTDEQVIKKVKSMIDGNIECHNEIENQYLECYLPQMLSTDELGTIIQEITIRLQISDMKGMGLVMKELQTKYPGMYDGKIASQIVKNTIS